MFTRACVITTGLLALFMGGMAIGVRSTLAQLVVMNERICALRHVIGVEMRRIVALAVDEKSPASSLAVPSLEEEFLQVRCYSDDTSNFFIDMQARDLVYDRPMVRVNEGDTVHSAVLNMREERATCALVIRTDATLMGIVDGLDIVRFMMSPRDPMQCSIAAAVRQCVLASPGAPLVDLVNHLKQGRRYIAIRNVSTFTVLSQGSIVRHVFQRLDESALSVTVRETFAHKKIITCTFDADAQEAFQLMSAFSVTSIPIIGRGGELVAVITAESVLHAEPVDLERNVIAYTSHFCKRDFVSCTHDDTLEFVFRAMIETDARHVYVLDGDQAPTNVISFVDLLRVCA